MDFKLSDQAKADLRDIGRETLKRFGKAQQKKYRALLTEGFLGLTLNPDSGRPRDELQPGTRSFAIGRHLILYRIREGYIEVVAIPHQSQDV